MPCYRKDDRAMRPIYPALILFTPIRPLLCADLILNEFKQIGFSALIEWSDVDLNADNTCNSVANSTQRHVPSINTPRSTSANLIFKVCTYCIWRPLFDGTPANIRILCISSNYNHAYILPLIAWIYLCSNFYGGLRNFFICARVKFRPFKVVQGHSLWHQSKATSY